MNAEKVVNMADFTRVRTKLVCSKCGAEGLAGCDCGEEYLRYANKTPKAEQVVEALRNPTNASKSDRAIAAELGVSQPTVSAVRKATDKNLSVEKRVGRDGKARKRPNRAAPSMEKVRAAQSLRGNRDAVAKQLGVSHAAVDTGRAEQRARDELLNELNVDPETLSMTAQAKLEVAKQQHLREAMKTLEARMRGLDEEVRQRVLKGTADRLVMLEEMERKARIDEAHNERMRNNFRPIYTEAEYKTLLKTAHPDNSASKAVREEALRLLTSKKLQLTGQK